MKTQSQSSAERELVRTLMDVLEEATDGVVVPRRDDDGPDSIRRLGLNSVSMLNFLVAVEDAFGIEWEDEIDEDVLGSFAAMARFIAAERGR